MEVLPRFTYSQLLCLAIAAVWCGASCLAAYSYDHTIYISPSDKNAEDGEACLTSKSASVPCRTLTWVFMQTRSSSTHYVLTEETYSLTNHVPVFESLTSLAITGEAATGRPAVINCTSEGIGFAFINVVNITLSDVVFQKCGALRNSTSKDFDHNTTIPFKVALYFHLCENLTMSHVNVTCSANATGMVLYNTNGTNLISNSSFSNNSIEEGSNQHGGGGVYIEFTYCMPGSLSCQEPNSERNEKASFTFSFCYFIGNRANIPDETHLSTYVFPYKTAHQSFGRGGGLSLFINGNSSNNTLNVTNCIFDYNYALWGGGVLVELHDNAHGNRMSIKNSKFSNNRCPYSLISGTGGGGLRFAHYVYGFEGPLPTRNTFAIDNCNFSSNFALAGAGVSVSWAPQQNLLQPEQIAEIKIMNSHFRSNVGKLGVGVHVTQFKMVTRGMESRIKIESCKFFNNTVYYYKLLRDGTSGGHLIGIGTVLITSSTVYFHGHIEFDTNNGTALASSGSLLGFSKCSILFSNNQATYGPGITLLGASIMELGEDTQMVFENNTADIHGGAIHVTYISREDLKSDPTCFFRYFKPYIGPDNWKNVTLAFINNREDLGARRNSIFATSLMPCSVVGGNSILSNVSDLFCWQGWSYYNDSSRSSNASCKSQIKSDIGQINYVGHSNNESGIKNHVKAFPGWEFSMPVEVLDDLGANFSDQVVFQVRLNESSDSSFFMERDSAVVNGSANTSVKMNLVREGEQLWYLEVMVDFVTCPPGFKELNDTCSCANDYNGALVTCNAKARSAHLLKNIWMGLINGMYYTAVCPPQYCNSGDQTNRLIELPHNSTELKEHFCKAYREGTMCGRCVKGYGPAVNSHTYECVSCTDINLASNIAKYVASVYLPLAALFTVLIVFDIRLTTGPANAFILYCQLVTSTFSLDGDGGIPLSDYTKYSQRFTAAYTLPYNVFNLEFIENYISPLCFSPHFNTLAVLCLDYCVAIFPLFMILLVVLSLKLRECCCCCCCCYSPKGSRKIQPSILKRRERNLNEALLPAFASFILLSYNKFSIISMYLTSVFPLRDENGITYGKPRIYLAGDLEYQSGEYYPYFLPATIIFCTFLVAIPLLLLEYPLKVFEYVILKSRLIRQVYPITKLHIFLDTFQGCYRNNMRFFAGLYFVFRLVINVSTIFSETWLSGFVLKEIACLVMVFLVAFCRPYKSDFINLVDIFIFTNLAVLNCLSWYLFEYSWTQSTRTPPSFVFMVQYILVYLPLVYMVLFLVLWTTRKHHHRLKQRTYRVLLNLVRYCRRSTGEYKPLDTMVKNNLTSTRVSSAARPPSKPAINNQMSEIDVLLVRAEDKNTYKPHHVVPPAMSVVSADGDKGEASSGSSVHQHSDSGVRSSSQQRVMYSSSYGSINQTSSTVHSDPTTTTSTKKES